MAGELENWGRWLKCRVDDGNGGLRYRGLRQPQAATGIQARRAYKSKGRPDEKTTSSRISFIPVVFPSPSTLQGR